MPFLMVRIAGLTLVEHGLGDIGGEGLGDGISELAALVDYHLDDEAEVCHSVS